MSKEFKSSWTAVNQFMKTEEGKLTLGNLDRLSRELLQWIVSRCQSDELLHVQEIVAKSEVASPATVHKCIDVLRRAKLISVEQDKSDQRRRVVTPTRLGLAELRALDKAFESWVKKYNT